MLLFALALLACAGLALTASQHRAPAESLQRTLRKLPLATTVHATGGEDVRVTGVVEYANGAAPLIAPLTGKRCVAWRVVVDEALTNKYRRFFHEAKSADFVLRDESGLAHVHGAKLTLSVEGPTWENKYDPNNLAEPLPHQDELTALFVQRSVDTKILEVGSARYSELILEEGARVTVVGRATWSRAPSQTTGYRDVGQRLVVGPRSTGNVLVSDDPALARP